MAAGITIVAFGLIGAPRTTSGIIIIAATNSLYNLYPIENMMFSVWIDCLFVFLKYLIDYFCGGLSFYFG